MNTMFNSFSGALTPLTEEDRRRLYEMLMGSQLQSSIGLDYASMPQSTLEPEQQSILFEELSRRQSPASAAPETPANDALLRMIEEELSRGGMEYPENLNDDAMKSARRWDAAEGFTNLVQGVAQAYGSGKPIPNPAMVHNTDHREQRVSRDRDEFQRDYALQERDRMKKMQLTERLAAQETAGLEADAKAREGQAKGLRDLLGAGAKPLEDKPEAAPFLVELEAIEQAYGETGDPKYAQMFMEKLREAQTALREAEQAKVTDEREYDRFKTLDERAYQRGQTTEERNFQMDKMGYGKRLDVWSQQNQDRAGRVDYDGKSLPMPAPPRYGEQAAVESARNPVPIQTRPMRLKGGAPTGFGGDPPAQGMPPPQQLSPPQLGGGPSQLPPAAQMMPSHEPSLQLPPMGSRPQMPVDPGMSPPGTSGSTIGDYLKRAGIPSDQPQRGPLASPTGKELEDYMKAAEGIVQLTPMVERLTQLIQAQDQKSGGRVDLEGVGEYGPYMGKRLQQTQNAPVVGGLIGPVLSPLGARAQANALDTPEKKDINRLPSLIGNVYAQTMIKGNPTDRERTAMIEALGLDPDVPDADVRLRQGTRDFLVMMIREAQAVEESNPRAAEYLRQKGMSSADLVRRLTSLYDPASILQQEGR